MLQFNYPVFTPVLGAGLTVGYGYDTDQDVSIIGSRWHIGGAAESYWGICQGVSSGEIGIEIGFTEGYYTSFNSIGGYSTSTFGGVDMWVVDITAGIVQCHSNWNDHDITAPPCGFYWGASVGVSIGWPVGGGMMTCKATPFVDTKRRYKDM